ERCSELVIPNIQLLVDAFHGAELPVIYLRLCGIKPDRSDLHPHFRRAYEKGLALGFEGIYPLQSEDESRVIDALAVEDRDEVICKGTYSAFTSSPLEAYLEAKMINHLV